MRRSRLRSAGSVRLALPALIALLSVTGYFVTSETIHSDRKAAAGRRAESDGVRAQVVLDRARAYVIGLGNLLAGAQAADQQLFSVLAGGTSASVGLVDALWLQSERGSLVARFATTVRPGLDVAIWPALGAEIHNQSTVFAVTASAVGAFEGKSGFFLLEASTFGRGPMNSGYLAVFVPQGWMTLSVGDDPREVAFILDGRRLEGGLGSAPAARSDFQALARRWRIAVGLPPASGLQSILPWLALAWPLAIALLAFLVGRAILGRKRAERQVERIFDMSLDMLGIAGLDGYFKRVNPSFERTLGYPREELLSRPFFDFIHPDDVKRSREALEALGRGLEVVQFANRYVCADGSVSWLEWNVRPAPEEGLLYAAARDVTDRRKAEDKLLDARRSIEGSRDAQRSLANEQAALRRVATLVAQGVSPTEVFDAVTGEVAQLLDADAAALVRYEPDGTAIVIAVHSGSAIDVPVGTRLQLEGESITARVRRTGAAASIDSYAQATGPDAEMLREIGVRSAAGAPILVEGRLWGVVTAAWTLERHVPPDADSRMAQFTELVATAIANASSRGELTASRARIVEASDQTRRRIERDLHDGTQQRLVSMTLALRAAEAKVPAEDAELKQELASIANELAGTLEDLQEISRGIHPAILSKGGLAAALKTLARRARLPVSLEVETSVKLPERVEVAAYYVISEALTNAAKHAQASSVQIQLRAQDSTVELEVHDDGVGGANPAGGSGLIGLRDRVEALGGTIEIASSAGSGTSLRASIPIGRSPS